MRYRILIYEVYKQDATQEVRGCLSFFVLLWKSDFIRVILVHFRHYGSSRLSTGIWWRSRLSVQYIFIFRALEITVSIHRIICSGYNTCTAQNGAASAARVKPTIACAKSPSYGLQCVTVYGASSFLSSVTCPNSSYFFVRHETCYIYKILCI